MTSRERLNKFRQLAHHIAMASSVLAYDDISREEIDVLCDELREKLYYQNDVKVGLPRHRIINGCACREDI